MSATYFPDANGCIAHYLLGEEHLAADYDFANKYSVARSTAS